MAFCNLEDVVASFSESSTACIDQLKILNNEVICKLHKILNVNETESIEDLSLVTTIEYV